MGQLYLMISIINRTRINQFLELYHKYELTNNLINLAYGTVNNEVLSTLGLENGENAVITSFVTETTWKSVKLALELRLQIDLPGKGVVFLVPISSFGGMQPLRSLIGTQEWSLGEESVLKNTVYELLVAVCNIGYSNMVMTSARHAGVGGGTVIHAKGTGEKGSEVFMGVTLASEKEIIYMVVRSERKKAIMEAIMKEAGLRTKANTIIFSLPVTETAGLRFTEIMEDDQKQDKEE